MFNIKKRNRDISRLLEDANFSTKIKIYFAFKTAGASYDNFEKNYTESNLNPITIRGYVRDIKAESLVWSQYGLSEIGAKEILVDARYAQWFRDASDIEIDGDSFQVYKEGVGNRVLIEIRPCQIARIILKKVS